AWAATRGELRARLALRLPRPTAALGALMIGASFWYVNTRLSAPLVRLWDDGEVARLTATMTSGRSLGARLLVIAIVPAVCEELVCRAILARGLRPATGPLAACALSAAGFAAFHLAWVRLVPTFLLGLVLAALTLATESIAPAMLVHALNNAIAIAIASNAWPDGNAALAAYPTVTLAAALALTTGGLALVLRDWHRSRSG
ncbi:MAG: CPBP family intramembrane metalloprotease, partial [Deltaproteobacteria bacterium]|nr:CPBP family intramembrane metalloprotease [Deltaproteobacteria bacterium]